MYQIMNTNNWCWSWNPNTLATWCKELIHLKRPLSWRSLRAGGEGDDRGWEDWMASPTQWTWVWVNSRSCWWTGRLGVLQFMGSQRVGHDWATKLNWKITADYDRSHEIERPLLLGRKAMTNLDSILKSRDYFTDKDASSQSSGFSSGHVWMWELDYKESWALKNWCFWTVVLEKTLESPLNFKEFKPVHPKGNQFCIFIGRIDAEAETPTLWPPDTKNWLTGKDPDAGKDWRQEEKRTTEDEMVGWNHQLDRHEFK